MNKRILEKALKIKSNEKNNAETICQRNLKVALNNPEFKTIHEKEQETIIKLARSEAEGLKTDKTELDKIKQEKQKILKEMNISESDLVANYSCRKCNDSGYIQGKFCGCLKKEISKILFEESGFSNLRNFSSSDFSKFDNPEKAKILYGKMKTWCNSTDKKNILLSGNTGVGKTYLTECMANELIQNKNYVVFTTAFNLNNDMLKYHTTFDEDKSDYLDKYLNADILFIDDLGTEPILKNVTKEYLYLILNERTLRKFPFIITTNLHLDEIQNRYGERILSRVVNKENSICLEIKNSDLRLSR